MSNGNLGFPWRVVALIALAEAIGACFLWANRYEQPSADIKGAMFVVSVAMLVQLGILITALFAWARARRKQSLLVVERDGRAIHTTPSGTTYSAPLPAGVTLDGIEWGIDPGDGDDWAVYASWSYPALGGGMTRGRTRLIKHPADEELRAEVAEWSRKVRAEPVADDEPGFTAKSEDESPGDLPSDAQALVAEGVGKRPPIHVRPRTEAQRAVDEFMRKNRVEHWDHQLVNGAAAGSAHEQLLLHVLSGVDDLAQPSPTQWRTLAAEQRKRVQLLLAGPEGENDGTALAQVLPVAGTAINSIVQLADQLQSVRDVRDELAGRLVQDSQLVAEARRALTAKDAELGVVRDIAVQMREAVTASDMVALIELVKQLHVAVWWDGMDDDRVPITTNDDLGIDTPAETPSNVVELPVNTPPKVE